MTKILCNRKVNSTTIDTTTDAASAIVAVAVVAPNTEETDGLWTRYDRKIKTKNNTKK